MDESSSEQQFCKLDVRNYLYCVKNLEPFYYIVLVGLMAGRQSDKILVDLKMFKIPIVSLGFSRSLWYSVIIVLPMHFSWVFG